MSKVFKIEETGQTLDVVLTSFMQEIDLYFKKDLKAQSQLHSPVPVITNKSGFHVCCGEKPKNNEALTITPLQMVWCSIVMYLQDSGYTENEIEKIQCLLGVIDKDYNTSMALLEFCLHYCLHNRQPLCFMVTKAGNGKIIGCEKMETFYNCDDEDYYINIRLHKILKKALPDFDLNSSSSYIITATGKEKELLQLLHSNEHITKVTINTKNGDIQSADVCELVPIAPERKYVQIMNEKSYQTVTIKRENGKDTFIERIYKKLFTPKLNN